MATYHTRSTSVTSTIRSLTTGSIHAAADFTLYSRSGKHVDDEVWDDGRIPAVDSNGYKPYQMTEFEPSDLGRYTTYLFDGAGAENGHGVFEPVEFVTVETSDF